MLTQKHAHTQNISILEALDWDEIEIGIRFGMSLRLGLDWDEIEIGMRLG